MIKPFVPQLSVPFIVDFEITQRCQCKCIFCEADIPCIKPSSELNTSEVIKILDKLAQASVNNIFFTGGEPMLRNDLAELINHSFKIGLSPCVSTTGYSFNGKGVESLIDAGLESIQISIHGSRAIHEMVVGKEGSYDVVLKNLDIAVKRGIKVDVACVGLKENLETIPDLIDDLSSHGVFFFRLLRYVPGYRKEMLEHVPPKQLVEKYLPKIDEAAKRNNIEIALGCCPGLDVSAPSLFKGVHPVAFTCPAGKASLAVMPNGDVYPCVFFKNNKEMFCGNILSDSIDEIWNNKKMVEFRNITPEDYSGQCGLCEKKWLCYSARCVAYHFSNDLYGDDISCYLINEKNNVKV